MSPRLRRRLARAATTAGVTVAGAAAVLVATPLVAATSPAAAAAPQLGDHSVTVTVTDVRESTPVPSATARPLTIDLSIRNNTTQELKDVTLTADRGDPINNTSALQSALQSPKAPSPGLVAPVDGAKAVTTLEPLATQDVAFTTTTATTLDAGVCLCTDAIYPLYFSAGYTGTDGATTVVGTAQTYVPAFGTTPHPAPLQVSWVWPLLDRPHRLSAQRYFLDDDLATEVATGGRLDRALQVVEQVAPRVPLTLLVDPDLLDELEVMADGYRVYLADGSGRTIAGIGRDAAVHWLDRFRAVIEQYPNVEIQLTAFADPDVESLTRSGLTWSPVLGSQDAQQNLADALGTRTAEHTVTWPVDETASAATLAELVREGTSTVILNDRTLSTGKDDPNVNALATVQTVAGPALAAVTSGQLEAAVDTVLDRQGPGLGALPELVARLAVRVIGSLATSHYVVLTPPRDLDVDPTVATRTILETASTFWTRATSFDTANGAVTASNRGAPRVVRTTPLLPEAAVDAVQAIDEALPGLTGTDGLFAAAVASQPGGSTTAPATPSTAASSAAPGKTSAAAADAARVAGLPTAIQRTMSSGLLDNPDRIVHQAAGLEHLVDQLRRGVHLVQPAGNGSYTLTSNDAPLPVTVANTLDVPVEVTVNVAAEGNLPGFTSRSIDVRLAANSTQQVRVKTHVDLTGRIRVAVTLSTRNGMSLGDGPLVLSVRNTALGTVGVAITSIAAGVLAIALLIRLYRAIAWRHRVRRDASTSA